MNQLDLTIMNLTDSRMEQTIEITHTSYLVFLRRKKTKRRVGQETFEEMQDCSCESHPKLQTIWNFYQTTWCSLERKGRRAI